MRSQKLRARLLAHHCYLRLCVGIAVISVSIASAFAQSSVSFTVPAGATNKPTLGYLKLVRGIGCSELFGAAVDRLGRPYVTGVTTGCDNPALLISGPNYQNGIYSNFSEFGWVSGLAIAVDALGNAYVTGTNRSDGIIDAVNPIPGCQLDPWGRLLDPVFLMKLNPSGGVVYSTCVPNALGLAGRGVAVDSSGAAYVTGDGGFVTKINATPAVVYSTVLASPTGVTTANAIAVDSAGNAYVTGTTGPGFPLVNPIMATGSGFLAKLNPSGDALVYSTYLTGAGNGVAVDATGNAYVTGGGTTKISPNGTMVYFKSNVSGSGIAIDANGGAYIVGSKPVTQLSKTGALVYSMNINLSSPGWQQGTAIAVDRLGTAYPVGITARSMDFPTTDGSQCASNDGVTCVGDSGFIGKVGPFSTASVSPTSATFGTQLVSTTSLPKRISLFNTGTAQMTVNTIRVTGDYKLQTNYCGNGVKPATHCDVYVTFTPKAGGTRTGILTFTDNASSSPQKVTLTGVGTMVLVAPTSLAFGSQRVGTTSLTKAITVTNKGTSLLTISSITKIGDFTIASKTCGTNLAAGASCKVNMAFRPTAKGTRTGSVAISHNGGASPARVSLTGTGI